MILLESKFSRINEVQFKKETPKLDIKIETEVSVQDKIISVGEKVTLVQKEDATEQFSFVVKMVGIFECIGESSLIEYEAFRVNGAAIIFPYIREYISNTALKAGLGMIIIPPVNFTANQSN